MDKLIKAGAAHYMRYRAENSMRRRGSEGQQLLERTELVKGRCSCLTHIAAPDFPGTRPYRCSLVSLNACPGPHCGYFFWVNRTFQPFHLP